MICRPSFSNDRNNNNSSSCNGTFSLLPSLLFSYLHVVWVNKAMKSLFINQTCSHAKRSLETALLLLKFYSGKSLLFQKWSLSLVILDTDIRGRVITFPFLTLNILLIVSGHIQLYTPTLHTILDMRIAVLYFFQRNLRLSLSLLLQFPDFSHAIYTRPLLSSSATHSLLCSL